MADIADLIDRNEFMRLIQKAYQAAAEKAGTYCKDIVHVVRCKDCRWGKEISGNIECYTDLNLPPEYHGYEWFCPNGERREDDKTADKRD